MKIGLTYTGFEHKHKNYINWLKSPDSDQDDKIEIVTLSVERNNAVELEDCDGLVLSGGIDSDPVFYNGSVDYPNKPDEGWHTERDLFEKSLYESALKKSIPILAVCRGLQLVNVIQGGTLNQDLGELNESHKTEEELDKEHTVNIYRGTLLSEIAQVETAKVNSAHHQAIKKLGEGLMINCMAEDGTVEGAEWKEKEHKPFLLCVQWHPERMYKFQLQDTPLSKNIRVRFIEEIKKSIEGKK
jgi:putative glutamine amidotransferase